MEYWPEAWAHGKVNSTLWPASFGFSSLAFFSCLGFFSCLVSLAFCVFGWSSWYRLWSNSAIFSHNLNSPRMDLKCGWLIHVMNHRFTLPVYEKTEDKEESLYKQDTRKIVLLRSLTIYCLENTENRAKFAWKSEKFSLAHESLYPREFLPIK